MIGTNPIAVMTNQQYKEETGDSIRWFQRNKPNYRFEGSEPALSRSQDILLQVVLNMQTS